MLERNFSSEFGRWAKVNIKKSTAFELKVTKTNSMPFSRLENHQIDALLHAKHLKLYYKIPDGSFSQSPFDSFLLQGVAAYVVIRYPSGTFYLIDIDVFQKENGESVRRSLTESRAKELCYLSSL